MPRFRHALLLLPLVILAGCASEGTAPRPASQPWTYTPAPTTTAEPTPLFTPTPEPIADPLPAPKAKAAAPKTTAPKAAAPKAAAAKPKATGPFKNCDAARAAGAAPVRKGQPGYSSKLDRDGDGVGCE